MNQGYRDNNSLLEYSFLFIVIVALWMPTSYSYILPSTIYSMMRWAQYLVAFCATLLVVVAKKINKIYVLNLLLFVLLLFSTIVNGGSINKCLNYVAPMLGTVSVITYCIGMDREKQLLRVIRHVLIVYILINIATFFLFPKGIYISEFGVRHDDKPNTFLGNRNTYKFYGLLLILVSYLEGFLERRKGTASRKMIIAIVLALIMELLGESLTGIIIITFIAIYYFFGEKMLRIRKVNPKVFFFTAVAVFIFLVVFIVAGQYTNIIELFFSGNVTFSNRTRIWLAAENLIQSHPIIGIGTRSSEDIYVLLRNYHSHNQFLEIALRGGILSLAIYVEIIWCGIKKLASFRTYEIVTFVSICIFAAVIIDMVECETYSYAILSYFTAIAYCWHYPAAYAEKVVKRKKKIVLKLSRG